MYEGRLLPSMAFVTPLCLIGVTALVLVVRMGRKLALERTLEWDDGLLCINFLLAGILNVSGSLLTVFGLGRDIDEVDKEKLAIFTKLAISAGIIYSISLGVSKALLADYFLGLVHHRRHPWRHVLKRIFLALLALQVFEEIMINLFACQPGKQEAMLERLGRRCLDQKASWFTGLTLNMAYAVVLPLVHPAASLSGWLKWPQEPPRQKMERALAFLGLALLFVATVGRTVAVIRIGSDITHDYAPGIMWSSAEADAFVICLCLPSWKKREGAGSSENKPQPGEVATMKPCMSLRKSIEVSCQVPVPVEGEVKGEEDGEGEMEWALLPGGLVPTAEERVGWAETVKSFPTEGRPKARMLSSQMGTTSYAEAVPSCAAGRREASRTRRGSRRDRERGREQKQEQEQEQDKTALEKSQQGGILVVTEVRREIVQDPDFPWIFEVGSESEAEAKGKAESEAAARMGQVSK